MEDIRSDERDGKLRSSTHRQKPFASFVVFDTEATGLKRRPKITELCMLAVFTDELKSTNRPRVVNKLLLCFNPESVIEPQASSVTGLYNDVLEQMAIFRDQASLVTGFLTSLPQPVCIIAHNGHRFDFPLLQSEFCKADCPLPADAEVFCADSLEAFRVLDGLPAIPEWVVQREKEEKQRKAMVCNPCSSTSVASNKETDSSVNMATSPAAQKMQSENVLESGTVSVSKRQVICTDRCTDELASQAKLPKMDVDAVPSLGSQSSVSDSDLVTAYDAAIAEADKGDVTGHVSPVHVMADTSLQLEQETTPAKYTSGKHTDHTPDPVVKKRTPVSFSAAQRDRVARRLFAEEPSVSVQGAVKDNSFQQNTPELVPSAHNTATCSSSQGSLPDEKIVQALEQAESEVVTSLLPFSDGAGEHVSVIQGGVDTNEHTEPLSCHQLAAASMKTSTTTPAKPPMPAETGLDPALSTQNQVSEVTSSSSSATKTPNSSNGALPSTTTPKQSYKLGELYKRQFGRYPERAHTAEDDCVSLLRLIVSKSSAFMSFVEEHAVRFDSVQPMY